MEEGKNLRFEALHTALSYALQKTLSKLTLDVFVSCFPNIDPTSLDYVRKQIIKSWQSRAELEFQKIFLERELKQKLDKLDEVVLESEKRFAEDDERSQHIDFISLIPSERVQLDAIPEKERVRSYLAKQLEEVKSANAKLREEIKGYKEEIDNDLVKYYAVQKDLETLDKMDEEAEDQQFRQVMKWAVSEIAKSV